MKNSQIYKVSPFRIRKLKQCCTLKSAGAVSQIQHVLISERNLFKVPIATISWCGGEQGGIGLYKIEALSDLELKTKTEINVMRFAMKVWCVLRPTHQSSANDAGAVWE
jgi:hypothetical protein